MVTEQNISIIKFDECIIEITVTEIEKRKNEVKKRVSSRILCLIKLELRYCLEITEQKTKS